MKYTIKALELSNIPVLCWTDSQVSLHWITTHPSRWKDFVSNRTFLIQELLPTGIWRFVPGKENPADCASRGLQTNQLQRFDLWWKGPNWLKEPSSSWPVINIDKTPESNQEERTRKILVSTISRPIYWNLLDRYSSLKRLLRVTAMCRRFASRLRKVPESALSIQPLTLMEIEQSRLFWIHQVQRAWFATEIRLLSQGKILLKNNLLVRLTPYIDGLGLLRVGGRLQNASIESEKHPCILPRQSPLTSLIIDKAHKRTLHGGTQVTLNFIRRSVWIVGGRCPVRSHILKCVRCAHFRGLRAQQLMGQLPSPRVRAARPFTNTGVDYAGPVVLNTWRGRAARTYKGYLAIFKCMATSAIHIEVVTDYTTDAFIAAYKRFTGRRGICSTLHSDCGTNFIGADSELKRLFKESSYDLKELASLLANDGTKWLFNPPSAPHFCGKSEAAVKSTKFHLKRILRDTILTYEELTTVTVQIEAVLNSRPLCPLSEDINDLNALIPGHFLMGDAPLVIPEPNLENIPISRLSRWQLLRQKVDQFWRRWRTECLQRYLSISKWHHPSTEIKIGSMVLIIDERYPPGKWPLARVTDVHPGPDGLIRVVTVKTAYSTYKRLIQKLCVLPIDPTSKNFDEHLVEGGR